MDALIQQLETRIRQLVERCEKLERDHASLAEKNLSLLAEKDTLLVKNSMAISAVRDMISHLESMEHAS